jgi:uncharacterized small protein (DUF1192 family)
MNTETDLETHEPEIKVQPEKDPSLKALRLAMLSILISLVGFGVLGYLHFDSQSAIGEAISNSSAAVKKEIKTEVESVITAAKESQLESIAGGNAELEVKLEGVVSQIGELESKVSQLQAEIEKNKILMKSSMKASKPAAKASPKSKTPAKATKAAKKGRK